MAHAAKLAELRALRASGKTGFSTYQAKEAESVYDEVDEESYKKVVRGRLDRDDFVVEDHGEGYADDGREDWQSERRPNYDTDSEGDVAPRGKKAKRKREDDREKEEKINSGISRFFSHNPTAPVQKPKAVATAEDSTFLSNLLVEVDAKISTRLPSRRIVKTESRRKTRVLSPPLSGSRDRGYPSTPYSGQTNAEQFDMDDAPRFDDGDAVMSEPPTTSSPVVNAVERKSQVKIKMEEEEDDDALELGQAIGFSGVSDMTRVNIKSSRPAPKIKQNDYPTPESSSPTRSPAEFVDPSSWNEVTNKLNVINSSPSTEVSTAGKIQSSDAIEADGTLRFFWLDYTELNGSLLLFGKVKNKNTGQFVSCFVKVDNVLRKLYFLPREHRRVRGKDTDEEIDMKAVYDEVDQILSSNKVTSHKIKPCSRKYAFELPHVPREADYLKLMYPYTDTALSTELAGETFSRVFGANTALFEQFVLWKKIMGPCWLKLQNPDFGAVTNASWCKLECQVRQAADISAVEESESLEVPPLTLMSISLRTAMNTKENKQEILLASARIYENVSLTDTTPPEKLPCKTLTVMRPISDGFPAGFKSDIENHVGAVRTEKTEQALLSFFLAHLQRVDPDVLMGHRFEDVDYSILLNRMRDRKTPGWHRIGRLRRSQWPSNFGKGGASFFAERQLVSGRLMCDLANDMGKSLMSKCQSWSLAEMCELYLGKGNIRREIDNETALRTWADTREGLMNYIRHCEADTYFIAALALKVQILPLSKVLTNLAGNSWARTLSGTRAERNEYILLHEFYRNKYICPDKIYGKAKKREDENDEEDGNADTKKKDKYKGGLVFEPEKGLYDRYILVMDFNSLYPSIIQEFNICFTTVDRAGFSEDNEESVPEVPDDQSQGILPKLIATLVNRRREVKKLMKDKSATPDQLATYDTKQLALKLTANSMYGCLGYTKSRFYARPLAMLTTFKGREILRSTKELAESRQLQVVYGDTDSVMINTSMDTLSDAIKVGNEFKKAVNERYKLLEIDIDNVFRRLLLHAKKKYAAINMLEVDGKYVEKLEVKGLDMRRREYCALSKETSSKLLGFLLSGEEPEVVVEKVHDYLRELSENMRQFQIPVQKYTIFTQLGKAPQEYPNGGSMPSVQVALKLMGKGKVVRAKDVMSFIITGNAGGSAEKAAKNACTPDEVLAKDSGLKPDIDYYLHKQILPPVERLCAPITLTNVTRLAECLGLDTSKYRVSSLSGNNGIEENFILPLESQIPDKIRFADCDPLRLHCLQCHSAFSFRSLTEDPEAVSSSGLTCLLPECRQPMQNITVLGQLEYQIRNLLAKYYEGWLVCDDPSCNNRTRQMSVYGHRCLGPQGLGKECLGRVGWELGEKKVWNQLVFWERAFDTKRAIQQMSIAKSRQLGEADPEANEKLSVICRNNEQRFETCREAVRRYLDKSGRQWVDMGSIFGFARTPM